jgi:hypothetical protein
MFAAKADHCCSAVGLIVALGDILRRRTTSVADGA